MIIDRIYETARLHPTKSALIHNDVVIDYVTFARTIETLRKSLERHDLPAGTIAVVLVSHLADAWALVFALRALGLTTIQVRSLVHAKERGLKNISCVVTTAAEQSAHDLAGNPLVGAKIIVVATQTATQLDELPVAPQRNRPSGGHILYTSGTTGDVKKLMWDSELEDARSSARSQPHGYDSAAVVHNLNYELWSGIGWKTPLSVWQAAGCLIIDQRPERFERFFRHAVTRTAMTPAAFRWLVATDKFDFDASIRCEFWVAGGAMGADLARKAIAKFGHTGRIYHYYSSRELTAPTLISRIQSLDDVLWLHPAPDRTIQIVDDNGHECSVGQEGDLRVLRTELDWHCYLDDTEATSKVFRDGFFYPGDRAMRRADGRIRVLGRVGDVLNVRGDKFAVGPIEQWIQQYLEVDEVCVFSGFNAAGQNEVVIAVKSDKVPPNERLAFIRREFEQFDTVRLAVLRDFPRTEAGTGKVRRAELRKILFSEPDNKS